LDHERNWAINPLAKLLIFVGESFGNHTAVVLMKAGHDLLVFDDFSNSSPIALDRARARWA